MATNPTLYGFRFLTGDINYLDYGAKWYRVIPDTREYHIIELINWDDAVGEREAHEIGKTYNMSLSIVDLDAIAGETLKSALQFCGAPVEEFPYNVTMDWINRLDEHHLDWLAEACHGYGSRAPMRDVDTSNFHRTFRELAKYSRELSSNQQTRDEAMERPVNRMGSTAEEYMRGDLNSALFRGLAKGDKTARIMAKIQSGGKITDAELDACVEDRG